MKNILFVILAVAIASCESPTGSDTAERAAVTLIPDPIIVNQDVTDGPVIAFIGGSITHGTGASAPTGGYAYQILGTKYKGIISAIPGSTSWNNDVYRVQSVMAHHPDYVIIDAGVNDEMTARGTNDFDDDITNSMIVMCMLILQGGATPIIVDFADARSIMAMYPNPYWAPKAAVLHYKVALANPGTLYYLQAIDMCAYMRFSGTILSALMLDGVHPNDLGHKLYADQIKAKFGW